MTEPRLSLNSPSSANPEEISIDSYDYTLPDNRIAKYPLPVRDQSKLLIYKEGHIQQRQYCQLGAVLPPGSLLVFNDTKVVEARLIFQKETGSKIEIFCLEPGGDYPDITTAMLQKETVDWKCLIGGAKKWKSGPLHMTLQTQEQNIELQVEKLEKQADSFLVRFQWTPSACSFAEILHLAGSLPLPPYLNRETEAKDLETYQTVYARQDGSVAAPTAGLHFTPGLLKQLSEKGIKEAFVTLHVGAGTFKPVKADKMKDHEMHSEFMEIPVSFIKTLYQQAAAKTGKILAVGTTSLRTLESLYWIGVKLLSDSGRQQAASGHWQEDAYVIKQWDPYRLPQDISLTTALETLIKNLQTAGKTTLITHTQIIIAPGYHLKVADGILTNFHQPRSTLLLLIAAIVGDDWRTIYQYALDHEFRFLSYGDGSLLWK